MTGYGVVEEVNHRPHFLAAGAIKAPARLTLSGRLKNLFDGILDLFERFEPDGVAIETPFLSKNFSSALKLGQACGVAMLAAETRGIRIFEYSPSEIKLAVVGNGVAQKQQVERMVEYLLGSREPGGLASGGSHHATDALAVAICHVHSRLIRERAAEGVG